MEGAHYSWRLKPEMVFQVSRLRSDFFRLKPTDDGHRVSVGGAGGGENLLEKMDLSNMFYDSAPGGGGGGGGKVFRLSFDVSQFRPEEINITTHDQRLIVHAKHQGKSEYSTTPCTTFSPHRGHIGTSVKQEIRPVDA